MSRTEDIFEKIKEANIFEDLQFDVPGYQGELKFAFSVRYKGTIFAIKDVITKENQHFIIRGVAVNMDEVYLNCEEIDSLKIERIDSYLVKGYKSIFKIIKASELKSRPVNIIIVKKLKYFITRDQ